MGSSWFPRAPRRKGRGGYNEINVITKKDNLEEEIEEEDVESDPEEDDDEEESSKEESDDD
jgi:hypothetical protein